MQPIDIYTANMTDHQRTWFYAEYEHARRDEVIGVLFAIFLGCFGIHHFYLRRNGLGILYLLLCWTGISAILGFIDAFFTPDRVRRYNAEQAAYISTQILGSAAYSTAPRCPSCGRAVEANAIFCPHCGATTAGSNPFRPQPAV
ncbi:MAG: putative rane protein [Edaphobacter sp.]|nr:putative rane protein [Edaphobacter sp.]